MLCQVFALFFNALMVFIDFTGVCEFQAAKYMQDYMEQKLEEEQQQKFVLFYYLFLLLNSLCIVILHDAFIFSISKHTDSVL